MSPPSPPSARGRGRSERGSVYPHHATVEWVEEELKELLPDVMIVKVERSSVVPEDRLQRMVGADVEIDYEPVRV